METRSDIVWTNGTVTVSVDKIETDMDSAPRDGKYIENGRIVIVRDGRKYNAMGLHIK